ncbi:MAG: thiamine phosphate synthase [Candidatus Methanomethylophilaceae archaeon]|jgi:thiamine-phosphate pyrophosphorylase
MIDLYVVTDRGLSRGRTNPEIARMAYEGGADIVQLRMKDALGKELLAQAKEIKEIADEMGKLFIVNDRVDIAMASEADGVHLGQEDIPLTYAREIIGDGAIIGISVNTVEQAVEAYENSADYVSPGAIFSTNTKKGGFQRLGLDLITGIREAVPDIPIVAIGGINLGNVSDVIKAGADSAAVVSAVVNQDDPVEAARRLTEQIVKVKSEMRSAKRKLKK